MRIPSAFMVAGVFSAVAVIGFSQDTLRVDVQLVNVTATVTDENGSYIRGLTASDFILEDDGVEQDIVHFTYDQNIPISVGIVIDTSGSMSSRMRTAIAAVDRFIDTLHEDDDVFVTTFSARRVRVQDLSDNREELARVIGGVEASGGTALYDAIAATVARVQEGRHDKRAILVLTDGSDTSSDLDLEDTLEAVRGAEVLVYGLGIDPTRFADPAEHVLFELPVNPIPGAATRVPRIRRTEDPADMEVLQSFAEASGGAAFLVSETWSDGGEDELDYVLDEVSAELRSQYTLGYYPSTQPDGRFHEIRVRTHESAHVVRARNGYRSRSR